MYRLFEQQYFGMQQVTGQAALATALAQTRSAFHALPCGKWRSCCLNAIQDAAGHDGCINHGNEPFVGYM
jgi:hypothetical protein